MKFSSAVFALLCFVCCHVAYAGFLQGKIFMPVLMLIAAVTAAAGAWAEGSDD